MCKFLAEEHKIVAIPVFAHKQTPENLRLIRFCFAKKDVAP